MKQSLYDNQLIDSTIEVPNDCLETSEEFMLYYVNVYILSSTASEFQNKRYAAIYNSIYSNVF